MREIPRCAPWIELQQAPAVTSCVAKSNLTMQRHNVQVPGIG
jgi:hypothetical protein